METCVITLYGQVPLSPRALILRQLFELKGTRQMLHDISVL